MPARSLTLWQKANAPIAPLTPNPPPENDHRANQVDNAYVTCKSAVQRAASHIWVTRLPCCTNGLHWMPPQVQTGTPGSQPASSQAAATSSQLVMPALKASRMPSSARLWQGRTRQAGRVQV